MVHASAAEDVGNGAVVVQDVRQFLFEVDLVFSAFLQVEKNLFLLLTCAVLLQTLFVLIDKTLLLRVVLHFSSC